MSTRPLWYAVNKGLVNEEVPLQKLDASEVLIKVKAIAYNPQTLSILTLALHKMQVSDAIFPVTWQRSALVRVWYLAWFQVAMRRPERGSYTNLVKVKEHELFQFNGLKFDSGKSIAPAAPELTSKLLLCLWDITKKNSQSGYAFIYGAVSSLEISAVQLAKYIGFNVIAVAPKKHKELLESVARRIGGDDIVYVYDTISSAETVAQVVKAVSTTKPVKVNVSLPQDAQSTNLPENIALDCPLGYLITDPKKFGPVRIDGESHFLKDAPTTFAHANQLLDEGVIATLPVIVVGKGIDTVPIGVDTIRKGVPGEKAAIRLD